MNNTPVEKVFSRRLICPNTWIISTEGSQNATATYLLLGEESALVIDTGEHTYNLRAYIESITNLPLIVANTHSHFDHTGNDYQFKDCPIYMSVAATKEVKKNIHMYLNPADFEYDYDPIGVEEGFSIDLGGRTVTAISFGHHSITNFCWLDEKYKLLFTGDEIESGQVLLMGDGPEVTIEAYYNDLKRLASIRDEGKFTMLCPEHNGSPIDASFIDILIANCEKILGGDPGSTDISSSTFMTPGSPQAIEREAQSKELKEKDPEEYERMTEMENRRRRSDYLGSSIVYDIEKTFLPKED